MSELAKLIADMVDAKIRAHLRSPAGVYIGESAGGQAANTLADVVEEATTLKVRSLAAEGDTGLTGDIEIGVSGGLLAISQAGQVITIELTEAAIQALFTGYGQIYSEEFLGETIWTVEHNLGTTPAVTVWQNIGHEGWGSAWGDLPWGGTEGDITEDTATPDIMVVDENTIEITWTGETSGKVVCVA